MPAIEKQATGVCLEFSVCWALAKHWIMTMSPGEWRPESLWKRKL